MKKRLYKSSTDKKICGVCAGIADFLGIDPTLVRAGYAILSIFTTIFPGVILYLVLAFIMPEDDGYVDTDVNDNNNDGDK